MEHIWLSLFLLQCLKYWNMHWSMLPCPSPGLVFWIKAQFSYPKGNVFISILWLVSNLYVLQNIQFPCGTLQLHMMVPFLRELDATWWCLTLYIDSLCTAESPFSVRASEPWCPLQDLLCKYYCPGKYFLERWLLVFVWFGLFFPQVCLNYFPHPLQFPSFKFHIFDLEGSHVTKVILNNSLSKMLTLPPKLVSAVYFIKTSSTALSVSLKKVLEGTELCAKRPHLKCLWRLTLNQRCLTTLSHARRRRTHQWSSWFLEVRGFWLFGSFCSQLLIHMLESCHNLSSLIFCLQKRNKDAWWLLGEKMLLKFRI